MKPTVCLCGNRSHEVEYDMEPNVSVHIYGPGTQEMQENYCKFKAIQHLEKQCAPPQKKEKEKREENDKRKKRKKGRLPSTWVKQYGFCMNLSFCSF